MRIGLYHGYELTGSGSNEYTRYLARTLTDAGHELHVICREPRPQTIPFTTQAYAWKPTGEVELLFTRHNGKGKCILHQLPHGSIRPVYLTDKQREGNVRSFIALSNEELKEYHDFNEKLLTKILSTWRLDVLHANHLVYQPIAALQVCQTTQTPLVIYPHGSSIEYTVKLDARYKRLALRALLQCEGLIIGNREVRDRILNLYPEHRETLLAKTQIVGVGVDTSLFQPLNRNQRRESIEKLMATHGGGGKPPELTREMYGRMETEGIEVIREYWNRYNHSLPDTNLNDHLRKIPWEQNILLFVGALTVGKGLQSLIMALPGILQQHPQTHLIIVGAGTYREVLEALVCALSRSKRDWLLKLCEKGKDLDRNEQSGVWEDVQIYLENASNLDFVLRNSRDIDRHVHFLGRLDHPRLRFLFPCADLAIFPSIVPEAYPLVLMESLSNGVLPLVTYFSGFKDGMDELTPSLGEELVEKMKIPIDPAPRVSKITSNLNELLAWKGLKEIHSRLRQIAVERYDWKIRAAQMTTAYRRILQNKSVPQETT